MFRQFIIDSCELVAPPTIPPLYPPTEETLPAFEHEIMLILFFWPIYPIIPPQNELSDVATTSSALQQSLKHPEALEYIFPIMPPEHACTPAEALHLT